MKYLVHLLWLGLSRFPDGTALFLWVEDIRPAKRGRQDTGISKHTRALSWSKIDSEILNPIGIAAPPNQSRHRENLILPTGGGLPISTAVCLELPDGSTISDDMHAELTPWEVPGYRLTSEMVLYLTTKIKPWQDSEESDCCLAPDAVFLEGIAALAVKLANNQSFTPQIYVHEAGPNLFLVGRWKPILNPTAIKTFNTLEATMPGIISLSSSTPKPGMEVLENLMDRIIRIRINRARIPIPPSLSWTDLQTYAELLIPVNRGAVKLLHPFFERRQSLISDWFQSLAPTDALDLNFCFRLEPLIQGDSPEDSGDLAEAFSSRTKGGGTSLRTPEGWRIGFLIQPMDDPSLLVPVPEALQDPDTLGLGPGLTSDLHDWVLRRIRRASTVSRPISTAILTNRLDGIDAGPSDAMEFMSTTAHTLREMGFVVLVPAISRLSARMNFTPRKNASQKQKDTSPLGKSWFSQEGITEYDWELALGGERMSHDELMRIAELKANIVRFRGQWVEVNPEEVRSALQLLSSAGKQTPAKALRAALTSGVVDSEEAGLRIEPPKMGEWLSEALEKLRTFKGSPEIPSPEGLNGILREYQKAAVSWLGFMREFGLGACLADDMGLGKTIELIGHILAQKAQGTMQGPVLLVCPTSVVGNWEREVSRFAPGLNVLVHHGQSRLSGQEFAMLATGYDIIICPYSLLHRDTEELTSMEWDTIALDEAQNIKNSSSKQAQAARQLQARHRVALTGTPVENHLKELWSIFAFLNPGLLGSGEEFRDKFEIPIEREGKESAADALKALAGPFILRRVKTDPKVISDLPPKQEAKVFCNLTKEQATLYQAVLADMLDKVETAGAMERRGMVLSTLTLLKQVCNHPSHFLKDDRGLINRSGKLERLTELMEEVLEEGDRALIFTQYTEMGKLLKRHLDSTFSLDIPFLHGGVARQDRDSMVSAFQTKEGSPVLLLSLKAGGTGLNLTAANHVFHYDRWWNPAVEDQATDRAFRIGQTRSVMVHKLICAGTLEERIDAMIEDKRGLAGSIISSAESLLTEMSAGELADVLSLKLSDVGDY